MIAGWTMEPQEQNHSGLLGEAKLAAGIEPTIGGLANPRLLTNCPKAWLGTP